MYNPYLNNYAQNNYTPYNSQNAMYSAPMNQGQQLIRVNGLEGAKAYQMGANSTVALFDSNNDIMYVKNTDGAGFGSIRAFKFVEMDLNNSVPVSEYATKNELEQLRQEVKNYAEQFISKSKSAKTKSVTDDSGV
jgi:hypothetical protein|nr:MAG TPA: hypothetical protein [Caudoviricetes sp.]